MINVVSISLSGYDAGLQDLQAAIEHPGTGWPFGMSSHVILTDDEKGVTPGTAKMCHLLIDHAGFVLVVCLGGCSMKRCNLDVVDSQAPCS